MKMGREFDIAFLKPSLMRSRMVSGCASSQSIAFSAVLT